MPGNAFIKFTDAGKASTKAESLQEGHLGTEGWIEIGDWSWDVEAEASHLKGTGAAVGKPSSSALSWSHYYDKSSNTLMQTIVKGTHFESATIDILKQTGKDKPEMFMQIIARDVFITKVSSKGGEDGAVSQDIEMVFKQVAMGYKPQGNDGKLGAAKFFRWNITEMTADTPKIAFTLK